MKKLRIVVQGYIVRGPLGGMAWHHLQYVLGLHKLGHDVLFIEDSDEYVSCYDPRDRDDGSTSDYTYGASFAADAFSKLGIGDKWAYYDWHTDRWVGPAAERAPAFCNTADVVLNISAINPVRPWTANINRRVLIDTDPAFTQIRMIVDAKARAMANSHTHFLTFAESIGHDDCKVPDDGLAWKPTRQPIVLDAWPLSPGRPDGRFTTVMSWDSYACREHAGKRYGMKSESFGPFMELPKALGTEMEIALGGETAPRPLLEAQGWVLKDSVETTKTPWSYQDYIRSSKGEFTIAKHGYVVSRCGWFSERSAAYLASGRPVVTQETGYSHWYPTGKGLLSYENFDQATAALREVSENYETHCLAARRIAEECFDSGKVLTKLLSDIGA